ncbi:hypothetical protein [Kordia sp.]|uniref:hypothetical protein n=1 Tax=Kordia sp. TaxID=1965332 RepID=UPI003D6B4B39
MKKERKMKLSKLKIAKMNYYTVKGGVASNACVTIEMECVTHFCNTDVTDCIPTTAGSRNGNSLK